MPRILRTLRSALSAASSVRTCASAASKVSIPRSDQSMARVSRYLLQVLPRFEAYDKSIVITSTGKPSQSTKE